MTEVGVPDGVYNVVHGGGEVGEMLTTHPDVDGITFTGETVTGARILHNFLTHDFTARAAA